MRGIRTRAVRAVLAGLVLALVPVAAQAQPGRDAQFFMRGRDCDSMTVAGKGLARRSTVRLTLVNRDNGDVMARKRVRASSSGRFTATLAAPMDGVTSARVVVTSAKGARLGFVEHTMAKGSAMCRLPFTGPFRPSLALASAGLLLLGAYLLRRTRGLNAHWPAAG